MHIFSWSPPFNPSHSSRGELVPYKPNCSPGHKSCTDAKLSGIPKAAVRKIEATSPMLEEILGCQECQYHIKQFKDRLNICDIMRYICCSSTAPKHDWPWP